MANTNTEKQRRFKERMYEAGFKQSIVWIKRKEPKRPAEMGQREFIQRFKKLTSGWDKGSLQQLYSLLIKITEAKKEAQRVKKNA